MIASSPRLAVFLAALALCTAPTESLAAKMPEGWYWPTGAQSDSTQSWPQGICAYLGWMGWNSAFGGYHLAKDMCNPAGSPVYAIGDGEVIQSSTTVGGYGPNGTAGGAVIVRHRAADGQWFTALYGHLDLPHGLGPISAGQIIGYSNTWSPPHVHLGIHPGYDLAPGNFWRGYTSDPGNTYGFVDPIPFLKSHPNTNDTQVTGDWNGDGLDLPWTFVSGIWQIPVADGGAAFGYGIAGDLPVVGDWDGDGEDDFGVFRPGDSPSRFYLDTNRDAVADWVLPLVSSFPQDIPVAGDWDGDGDDDVGAWDSSTGIFYLFEITSSSTLQDHSSFQMGLTTDRPFAGNWDGIGADEVGVFRANEPTNSNNFYFRRGDGTVESLTGLAGGMPGGWGNVGDVPVIGDWNDDGYDTIGLFRPSTGEYFYNNDLPKLGNGATPPAVTTNSASSVGETGATLNGTANPNGSLTSVYFQYGTSTTYGSTTASTSVGSGSSSTPFNASLSGLTCNTLYHFRAVATSSNGTSSGADAIFTTTACSGTPPTVTTQFADDITPSAATLIGSVNPNGSETSAWFQYGTTTAYGNTTASQSTGSGTSFTSFVETINGLSCGTLYHFRSVASNSGGESYGTDVTFTTAACSGLPAIHFTSPSGGESWTPGSVHTLTWTSSGLSSGGRIYLFYWDGSWQQFADVAPTETSYDWTLPSVPVGPTSLWIGSWFNSAWETWEQSSSFTINVAGTPAIHFTSPGGGESWISGSQQTITWTSSDLDPSGRIYLYYWDGGWQQFADVAPTATSYDWTLPNTSPGSTSLWIGSWFNGAWEAWEQSSSFTIVVPPTDFYTLAPCRVVDTRAPDAPLGGPALVAGGTRTFALAGACGVPATAKAISVNVAVTGATSAGNLRLYPGGSTVPSVSTINYAAGQTRSNNAVVSLNQLGELGVFASQTSGVVHFILDVNGYFK